MHKLAQSCIDPKKGLPQDAAVTLCGKISSVDWWKSLQSLKGAMAGRETQITPCPIAPRAVSPPEANLHKAKGVLKTDRRSRLKDSGGTACPGPPSAVTGEPSKWIIQPGNPLRWNSGGVDWGKISSQGMAKSMGCSRWAFRDFWVLISNSILFISLYE